MKNKTVEIKDLSIGYRERNRRKTVAQGLNSSLFSGELTCLTGANGVGKSTLLRTLTAFQPSLSGEIRVLGKEVAAYSGKELSKMIGVVLTEKVEVRDMSVVELVRMGRSPYTGFWGKYSPEDEEKVGEAMEQVRISGLAHRSIQTLSDGERQKVMIAKVLAQQTPIIFLDEPTAFLDFPSKIEIMRLLYRLSKKNNKTIFLSTHDLELALQIADQLWMMDRKQGLLTGTPGELIQNGTVEKFFRCEGVVFERDTGFFKMEKQMQ